MLRHPEFTLIFAVCFIGIMFYFPFPAWSGPNEIEPISEKTVSDIHENESGTGALSDDSSENANGKGNREILTDRDGPNSSENGDPKSSQKSESDMETVNPAGAKEKPAMKTKTENGKVYSPKNRPWIIKGRRPEKPPSLKTLQQKLKWKNKHQEAECKARVDRLKDCFLKTRYYSIQGDSCVTARYAASCLELSEQSRKDCPTGFLDAYGYTDRIIRNWGWLEKLGKEGCLK